MAQPGRGQLLKPNMYANVEIASPLHQEAVAIPGQSPRTVEDQISYPLTTALVSVPGSKVVRGYSFFGYSLVYVIFEDGTDLYWA